MDRHVFEPVPGRELRLSVSAGAAIFPHDGDSYESLMAAADTRMYADKTRRKRQGLANSSTSAGIEQEASSPDPTTDLQQGHGEGAGLGALSGTV